MGLVPQTFKSHPGDVLDVTLGGSVVKGQPAMVGDLFGVYMNDGVAGQVVPFLVEGCIDIAKAAGAIAQGVKLYWDAGAGKLTTDDDDGDNPFAGHAALPAGASDLAVRCKLN
jgi:predicted RecA/RadA family phage recombinase